MLRDHNDFLRPEASKLHGKTAIIAKTEVTFAKLLLLHLCARHRGRQRRISHTQPALWPGGWAGDTIISCLR